MKMGTRPVVRYYMMAARNTGENIDFGFWNLDFGSKRCKLMLSQLVGR
jgi:hypothetical protein